MGECGSSEQLYLVFKDSPVTIFEHLTNKDPITQELNEKFGLKSSTNRVAVGKLLCLEINDKNIPQVAKPCCSCR